MLKSYITVPYNISPFTKGASLATLWNVRHVTVRTVLEAESSNYIRAMFKYSVVRFCFAKLKIFAKLAIKRFSVFSEGGNTTMTYMLPKQGLAGLLDDRRPLRQRFLSASSDARTVQSNHRDAWIQPREREIQRYVQYVVLNI